MDGKKHSSLTVNDAWVVFIINQEPLQTEEGEANIFVVMDVASKHAIGHSVVLSDNCSPPIDDIERIFAKGWSEHKSWPSKLLIADNISGENNFYVFALTKGIRIEIINIEELSPLVASLRDSFSSTFPHEPNNNAETTSTDDDVGKEVSPYAPIRFRNQPWWLYSLNAGKQGLVKADGRINSMFHQQLDAELLAPMTEMLMQHMSKSGETEYLGETIATIKGIHNWAPLIAQYELNGRQIFDLHDDLVMLLEQTDFSDATLEEWNPPYDAFFVRFGKCEDIKMIWEETEGTYEYLDGVFVAVAHWDELTRDTRIKFAFSTVKDDGSGTMFPGYFADILPDEKKLPIKDAINSSLKRRVVALKDVAKKCSSENEKNLIEYEIVHYEEAFHLLTMASELIVNALFYLENIGNYGELQPGRDTPPELEARWANSPPQKRHKLKSRLTKEGYSLVYLVGQEVSDAHYATKGKRSFKFVFWRRGHWRRQRYGKGRTEVKRIWIKPVMVGGSNNNLTSPPGHIYITGSDEKNRTH